MILLIDNYDSFTYNLYQYLGELGESIVVKRNDKITLDEIRQLLPTAIIISPGPGRPENAGICIELIKEFYKTIPILGVCLGHQAIGYAFGAKIIKAQIIMHGKVSNISYKREAIFQTFSSPLEVMRYHSLVIEKDTLPNSFEILATSKDDGEIMGIKHINYPVYGIQFHPESIGTKEGLQIINNFLLLTKEEKARENIFRATN